MQGPPPDINVTSGVLDDHRGRAADGLSRARQGRSAADAEATAEHATRCADRVVRARQGLRHARSGARRSPRPERAPAARVETRRRSSRPAREIRHDARREARAVQAARAKATRARPRRSRPRLRSLCRQAGAAARKSSVLRRSASVQRKPASGRRRAAAMAEQGRQSSAVGCTEAVGPGRGTAARWRTAARRGATARWRRAEGRGIWPSARWTWWLPRAG